MDSRNQKGKSSRFFSHVVFSGLSATLLFVILHMAHINNAVVVSYRFFFCTGVLLAVDFCHFNL